MTDIQTHIDLGVFGNFPGLAGSVEQGSEAWRQARIGRATASRVADIVATNAKGYAASRANYCAELVLERMSGVPAERFKNAAMVWGTETEPQARDAYAFMAGVTVEQVGFIQHPTIELAGASPDGIIGDDGLVEIKCGNTATHIELLRFHKISDRHITQMQFQMATTGRQWCDYVSFDPRMEPKYQLWFKRVPRNDMVIDRLNKEVVLFLSEVDAAIADLRKQYG